MKINYFVRTLSLVIIINVFLLNSFSVSAQIPTYDANQYMFPYWLSDTMYNESVLMVSNDGFVAAEAPLLFAPIKILSVKNATLTKEYVENVDWIYENGKLKLLLGSSAAFLTNSQLYPSVSGSQTQPKLGGGYVLFSEGHYFHDLQLAVTYTHQPNVWAGPVPFYDSSNLPKTLMKLNSGVPVKIVFIGNSITNGSNASGRTGVAPYMPSYSDLVINKLKNSYNSPITWKNVAVGGKDALWGLQNVETLVTPENPDLTVISFGMNDGTGGVLPSVFKTRIQGIMDAVKSKNPNAEFILISPTLANPESTFAGQQVNYNAVLQELKSVGTVVVNMTGVHQELLKHKLFRCMTGNNINHPNDFLHRWYAQQICGLLIKDLTKKPSLGFGPFSQDAVLTFDITPSQNWSDFYIKPPIEHPNYAAGHFQTRLLFGGGNVSIFNAAYQSGLEATNFTFNTDGTKYNFRITLYTSTQPASITVEAKQDGASNWIVLFDKIEQAWGSVPFGLLENNPAYLNITNLSATAISTGISSLRDDQIKIFPRLVVNNLNISSAAAINNVRLYSETGILLKNISLKGNNETRINVQNLNSGIYYIHIITKEGKCVKKFIKK